MTGGLSGGRSAFVGGKVWTAGFAAPRFLDVLVANGRIARVARTGELDTDGAQRIDMSGRLLVPGFQDAHIHPAQAGATLLSCDLTRETSADGVLAVAAAYAATLPADAWVTGGGWDRELFPAGPTRGQLEAVTGGRPAFLRSYDCHGAWVNSTALARAGVVPGTPDPERGFFLRDDDDLPVGVLEEGAMALVAAHLPPETTQDQKRALLRANEHLLSIGITQIQDAIVGTGLGFRDQLPAYRDLLRSAEWLGRVTAALWWDPARGIEQIDELAARRKELESCAGTDRILADTVKLMVDGTNTVFLDADAVREATVALDARALSCHYHSYGELSTKWILDGVAEARRVNKGSGGRHQVAHLFVIADDDFARFAELNVTANVQAAWGYTTVLHDLLSLVTCSQDPHTREYAFGRLVATGTRLAAGSDWPVTTPDPLEATRLEAFRGRDRKPTGAEGEHDELDGLDLQALLTAYTAGSAYVNGRATSTGRIASGFLADLVVLDRDPFVDDDALRAVAVEQTWFDGAPVYVR